jgi:hypothetical protein
VRVRGADRDQHRLDPAAESDGQDFVVEESLGYLVNRVARSMAHQLGEELGPAGVGIGQWAVLMFFMGTRRTEPGGAGADRRDRTTDDCSHHRPHGPRRSGDTRSRPR